MKFKRYDNTNSKDLFTGASMNTFYTGPTASFDGEIRMTDDGSIVFQSMQGSEVVEQFICSGGYALRIMEAMIKVERHKKFMG